MGTRTLSARGRAAPELVWERYAQIALWPTWSPQIRRVTADAARIGLGVRGLVGVPAGLQLPFTVTAADADARTWSWVVGLGPASMTLNHEVHPLGRGSATVLLMEGPDPVLLAYAPLAWIALRRLVSS